MSILQDGRRIVCDGPGSSDQGCDASAYLPVALQPLLTQSVSREETALGWLFVTDRETQQHYCPDCADRYLSRTQTVSTGVAAEV